MLTMEYDRDFGELPSHVDFFRADLSMIRPGTVWCAVGYRRRAENS
jgi:hypothetical protein